MGGDKKSGADSYHQRQHHDTTNHHRKHKQQHQRQMLPDSLSAADGKAAAPSSGQPQALKEQDDSTTGESVEDVCNLVVSDGGDGPQKAAEGINNAGGMRSYYGRRDAASVGGVAISWLASVSRRTPQVSQPQTQHPLEQEQQHPVLTQQLEEAAEVEQDGSSVPDPCCEGGE